MQGSGRNGSGCYFSVKGRLAEGIEIVLDYTNFDKHIEDANLIITGEGRIDKQTAYGKAPVGVAGRAKRFSVPVIAIEGLYHLIIQLCTRKE